MKNSKRVKFVENLFGENRSYFKVYFKYLKTIDQKGKRILHLGSGWDKRNIGEKFKHAKLVSLDMDFNALRRNRNSVLVCGNAHTLPFLNEAFDYIICEDFVEHLEFPKLLLSELGSVLKKNGEFIFTTPGGWSYIAIVSKMTPLKLHKWYNRFRNVDTNDIYPAFYRFNSGWRIKKVSRKFGFSIKRLDFVTGYPSYFNFSKILSVIFGIFHYFISRIEFLNRTIGINIFCVLKKT